MEHIKNKTYEELPDMDQYPLGAELQYQLNMYNKWTAGEPGATRQSTIVIGPHGFGKTAFVKDFFSNFEDIRVVEKSLAQTAPENFFVPFPVKLDKTEAEGEKQRQYLKTILLKELKPAYEGEKLVLFLDEVNRVSHRRVLNLIMEITQEFTIAGIEMPWLVGVICAGNPPNNEYMGITAMDYAQADRFNTIFIDENSTPWRHALAYQFPKIDLKPFFAEWAKLTKDNRLTLPPRVLEFFLLASENHIPQEWVLPFTNCRQKIHAADGTDVTREVFYRLAQSIGQTLYTPSGDLLVDAVKKAYKNHWRIRLLGDPGIGKTSKIKALVKEAGLRSVYKSIAQISPEDLSIPVPQDGELETLLMDDIEDPTPFALILDEFSRASTRTAAAAMELTNNFSLGGISLDSMKLLIAVDNKPTVNGLALDTGRIDIAQASRFVITIELDSNDTGWQAWLRQQYGDELASAAIDWRSEDLSKDVQALATPRLLQRLLDREVEHMPLEGAIPVVGTERAPLVNQLMLLRKRFAGTSLGLREVLTNFEHFRDVVARRDRSDAECVRITQQILTLLKNADIVTLQKAETNKELGAPEKPMTKFMEVFPPQERLSVMRSIDQNDSERSRFWADILTFVATKETKAKAKLNKKRK